MSRSPDSLTTRSMAFPTITMPMISPQQTSFMEPLSFISPEQSVRMQNSIMSSKLNDFKVLPRVQKR